MNSILTTDLHLTAHSRDAYRWDLFPWLRQQIGDHHAKYLFLLGDLTEAKDYHSAKLVNSVVDTIIDLYKGSGLKYIYIIAGNHDGFDPNCPYFRFLCKFSFIRFITTPFMETFDTWNVLMLPHSRNPVQDWEAAPMYDADLIFMHATVKGSISETGHTLSGVPPEIFRRAPRATIYSGDVHVPQTVGRINYVGTPYQVRFGTQRHECRVVLLKDFRDPVDLHFETLWRYIIDVVPEHGEVHGLKGLRKGDQVKIRLHLSPAQYVDFQRYKRNVVEACKKLEVEFCGLELVRQKPKITPRGAPQQLVTRSNAEIFKQFCTQQKVDEFIASVGEQLIK